MSNIAYRNFDLTVLQTGDVYQARVESDDAGECSHNFTVPFSEDKLELLIGKLGPSRRMRSLSTPLEAARTLGGQFYKAVFTGPIGHALARSIEAANRGGERLRIRLRLTGVPELANLPWEYLYDEQSNRFLALSNKTSIVRYLEIPFPPRPLAVEPPLRVLVMASRSKGWDELGVETEWKNLQTALGKMPDGLVELDRLEIATLSALQKRLSHDRFHIFHYIGHGGIDPKTNRSVLVMEDDNQQADYVDGERLGWLLHNHDWLRLVVLNSCEGAMANLHDVFSGVAQSLIGQEIPAVIAMQFKISDDAAITLAEAFYESLARGSLVDAALSEARLAIFAADNNVEWGTPVLYLRAPDGRIFDIDPSLIPALLPTPVPEEPTPPSTEPAGQIQLPPTAPTGALSSISSLYIEREADRKALQMANWSGGITLSIHSSGQTGASSLLRRVMDAAKHAGKQVVHIDFQKAFDPEDIGNSEDFHHRFCLVLANRLGKEDRVAQQWDKNMSLSIGDRCTIYLQYLLQSLGQKPLMLAMDEVDRLIDTEFRSSFFGMVRSWHNERASDELFERLDMVIVTSLEPHQLIADPNQSPFNVGEVVRLNDFTPAEAAKLNTAYGAQFSPQQLDRLMSLIGGLPNLLQLALHGIAGSNFNIEELFRDAHKDSGPFGRHLSFWYAFLRGKPQLRDGVIDILSKREPEERVFLTLRKLGLVRREGRRVQLRCKLYEDYFREQFNV